jgi:hypothetical protein
MGSNIEKEVERLRRMTVDELRVRYTEVFGEPARACHRAWLLKRIVWRLQALAEGDLSERARRRAVELANDADLHILPTRRAREDLAGLATLLATTTSGSPPDRRLPPPGTILVRRYRGQSVQVKVLSAGFEYQETNYGSLSAVAKAITGSHCNGFLFFRLTAPRGVS